MHNTGGQAACLTLCGGGVAGTLHMCTRTRQLDTGLYSLLYVVSTYTRDTIDRTSVIRALMSPKRKHAMQGGTVGVGWETVTAETPQKQQALHASRMHRSEKPRSLHAPPLGTTLTQATHGPRRGCAWCSPCQPAFTAWGACVPRARGVCVQTSIWM